MQVIKERDYLFREKPKRVRPALAVMALGAASLVVLGAADLSAGEGEPPTGAAAPPAAAPVQAPVQVYGAVGGKERFVLETRGAAASIRFLCAASEPDCETPAPAALRTVARDGAQVLTDQAGRPVLTLAARGARLHAGSDAVPASVPIKGRAVLPTNAEV